LSFTPFSYEYKKDLTLTLSNTTNLKTVIEVAQLGDLFYIWQLLPASHVTPMKSTMCSSIGNSNLKQQSSCLLESYDPYKRWYMLLRSHSCSLQRVCILQTPHIFRALPNICSTLAPELGSVNTLDRNVPTKLIREIHSDHHLMKQAETQKHLWGPFS